MATVKVALDNLSDDTVVEIPYLGKFNNNSSTEVDERKWERFKRNWPGASDIDSDTLEISTQAASKATKAHKELRNAVRAEAGEPVDEGVEPLSSRKKADLEELAHAAGQLTDGMTKDEIVDSLTDSSQEG